MWESYVNCGRTECPIKCLVCDRNFSRIGGIERASLLENEAEPLSNCLDQHQISSSEYWLDHDANTVDELRVGKIPCHA